MSNMTQQTKEQLESRLIAAVKSIINKESDSAHTRGYVCGIQDALGINDTEMRKLVPEAKIMKSYIVLMRDDDMIAILTTKKALKHWMKINRYKFISWTSNEETKHSEFRIVKMGINDDDDPSFHISESSIPSASYIPSAKEAIRVSYHNTILTENASDSRMTWLLEH